MRCVASEEKIEVSGLTGFCIECCSELNNPEQTLLAMLSGKVNLLPNHIQSVYVQNILKILNIILKEASQEHIVEVIFDSFFAHSRLQFCSCIEFRLFSAMRNNLQ